MSQAPPIPATNQLLEGHCYCGSITYEVDARADEEPIFAAYCHCDSCRRAHAAPLYRVVCIDARRFEITAGAELLTEFRRPEVTITRAFCSRCGSKILNRFGAWTPGGKTPLVFFPDLLTPSSQAQMPAHYRPQKHNRPEECVLDWDKLAELAPPLSPA